MSLATRFAPTPSGFLHQGNAFNFLLTWLIARSRGGSILLRIDDLDEDRVRIEYLEDIFRSLDWMGLDWDRGPFSVDEQLCSFRQRAKIETYQAALQQLQQCGWLFACECSRKDIQTASNDGGYPGTCLNKSLSFDRSDVSWRIRTPWPFSGTWQTLDGSPDQEDLSAVLRHVVLRKKDGWPSYQLVSVVEDIEAQITHIVRGADLRPSTACQVWLASQLNLPAFSNIRFHHHGLLLGTDGEKLSKSAGAISLKAQYKSGKSPEHLVRAFAGWVGWLDFEGSSAGELLEYVINHDALDQLT